VKNLIYILSLYCLCSCGPSPHYSSTVELTASGWSYEDKAQFQPTITDTTSVYELQLIIDHQDAYTKENIYLAITTGFPNQEEKREQLTIDLASNDGKWVGNCSGANCKCKVFLLENFKFPVPGKYDFTIEQYTRESLLKGVNSLTLELYKLDQT